jgi:ribonucleotide monophosphatase NagD (HAD superfamily)
VIHKSDIAQCEGIIFDLDGVLEYRGQVFPGAIELIAGLRRRGLPVRVVTNSTLKNRRSCAAKLRRQGFSMEERLLPMMALAIVILEMY